MSRVARILDGKQVAEKIRSEVKQECEQFKAATGVTPRIVFILAGDNPASQVYVKSKETTAREAGFSGETIRLDASISQKELLATIHALNRDPDTHAILVQLPLPLHIDEMQVIEAIDPAKDIDGFHPINVGRLSIGRGEFFAPCTPAGIVELFIREKIEVSGKHAVIVGRSNIVGKPMALLLVQKAKAANAVVTIAHTGAGPRLGEFTRSADILISAVGVANLITREMVKEGAVVIDVGMNRIEDSSRKSGYRLTGDVDFEGVSTVASAITPVPGGVGPLTIAMVLKNTLLAASRAHERSS